MIKILQIFISLLIVSLICGCEREAPIPKPKGYPRMKFPERSYETYQNDYCPLTFEKPVYAQIIRDTLQFNKKVESPCWFDIKMEELGATIHISYKDLEKNKLSSLLEDMHKLTYKHAIKAEYIDEQIIHTSNNVHGLIFSVGGNAASSSQFFLTDSTHHFIRGALYFNTAPNEDSLTPVIQFVQADIEHMINTLHWK